MEAYYKRNIWDQADDLVSLRLIVGAFEHIEVHLTVSLKEDGCDKARKFGAVRGKQTMNVEGIFLRGASTLTACGKYLYMMPALCQERGRLLYIGSDAAIRGVGWVLVAYEGDFHGFSKSGSAMTPSGKG
jgi:hypothetical protein